MARTSTTPLIVLQTLSLKLFLSASDVLRGVDAAEFITGRVPLRRPVKLSEVSLFCDESGSSEDMVKVVLFREEHDDDYYYKAVVALLLLLLLFMLIDLDVGNSLRCNVRFTNRLLLFILL